MLWIRYVLFCVRTFSSLQETMYREAVSWYVLLFVCAMSQLSKLLGVFEVFGKLQSGMLDNLTTKRVFVLIVNELWIFLT